MPTPARASDAKGVATLGSDALRCRGADRGSLGLGEQTTTGCCGLSTGWKP